MPEFLNNGALASWIQDAIYLATLIVLYYQLSASHLRKRTQTQIDNSKYSDYIRCQIDYTQTMRQLLCNNLHDSVSHCLLFLKRSLKDAHNHCLKIKDIPYCHKVVFVLRIDNHPHAFRRGRNQAVVGNRG